MSEEKIEKIIAKQNAAQIDTCNNMKPTVVGPINWEIIRERERESGRKKYLLLFDSVSIADIFNKARLVNN